MPGVFDTKYFNAEVFGGYVDRVPNLRMNRLLQSGAIRNRPELAANLRDETGGNYIATPLLGLIGGTPGNYDGLTDISLSSTTTYMHSRIVVGRQKGWEEKDFSYDITGGVDFMANAAAQVSKYWADVDQDTLTSILNGIFAMTGDANLAFVNNHTSDITAVANTNGVTGFIDAPALNSALQKACGSNRSAFSVVIAHSTVVTNLENANIVARMKVKENGIERETGLGTIGGRLLLEDDNGTATTTEASAGTQGVYTVTISTALASGDSVKVAGVTYSYSSGATTASAQATALATAIGSDATAGALYSASASDGVVTLTEKSGKYGTGAPALDATGLTTGVVAVATTTAGKAPTSAGTVYTTYILGAGAFERTDCGAKVPYEMSRDPLKFGGKDMLITRQRKCFAPYGISFTKASMSSTSPTALELENGANWELVHSPTADGVTQYLDHKAIPIARVLSLG